MTWGKGKWPKPQPRKLDWDEVFAQYAGDVVEAVEVDGANARFTLGSGKELVIQMVTVGNERRWFEAAAGNIQGKLVGVEIVRCHQVSDRGVVPVHAVATIAVKTDDTEYVIEAHNEHTGTSGDEASFRFRCV